VYDCAAAGYAAQGNEFSYHMLFTAAVILNSAQAAEEWTVHPWIHDPSNHVSVADMLRPVPFPDVAPCTLGETNPDADLSMAAGEFLEVYAGPEHAGAWDAVVTCFFIDTAPVVLEYVDAIWRLLRPGGWWINLGPLLYHWQELADGERDGRFYRSVELTYEEVRHAVAARGFHIAAEATHAATYAANQRSMLQSVYSCRFFSAQKPAVPGGDGGGAAGPATSSTAAAVLQGLRH
jgi:carnosine N-methyltransferase